ncbi:AI-2E family transporter [Candidatus Saccharibacteria bacterium]|nr:AI-2E family transporter [Candidatus Saccharibacteria bacterium]
MSTTTKVQIDTKTFVRFWLVIIGFIAVGYFLYKASFGLSIIFAALFFALAISPLIRRLGSIFKSKGRGLPIAISYIIVVGFIITFCSIVIPTVANESIKFFRNLPTMITTATEHAGFIDDLGNSLGIENLQGELTQIVTKFSDGMVNNFGDILTSSINSIASFFAVVILALVLAFFMLTEGPKILDRIYGYFGNGKNARRTQHVIGRLATTVSKYVSSAITVGLINACATSIAAFIICLIFHISPELAIPFGLITGVFSLIPMFGSFIGGAIVALLLGFNAMWAGIAFIIYTIVYLQIEANIISPKIQGKGMNLPALIVLSAVTIGVYTFGLAGAIISIPIAGCIKVLIEEYGSDLMDDGKINASNFKPTAEEKAESKRIADFAKEENIIPKK